VQVALRIVVELKDRRRCGSRHFGVELRHGPAAGQRLVLELDHNAQRQLGPDTVGPGHGRLVLARHGLGQFARRQDVQHGLGRLGTHSLDRLQQHEHRALLSGQEAEQAGAVLAGIGLNVQ
jgi:hypothetical protein